MNLRMLWSLVQRAFSQLMLWATSHTLFWTHLNGCLFCKYSLTMRLHKTAMTIFITNLEFWPTCLVVAKDNTWAFCRSVMKHNHIPFISLYTRFSLPPFQGTAEARIKRNNMHTANLFSGVKYYVRSYTQIRFLFFFFFKKRRLLRTHSTVH